MRSLFARKVKADIHLPHAPCSTVARGSETEHTKELSVNKSLLRRFLPVAAAATALSLTACAGGGTQSQNNATGPVEEPSEQVTISYATWQTGDEIEQL